MKTFVLGRAPRRPLTRSLRSEAARGAARHPKTGVCSDKPAGGDPLLDKNRLRPPYFSAQRALSARLFPHSRLVETGGRRHPPAARRNVRSAHLRCRWRRPLTKRPLPGTRPKTTGSDRAPGEILPFQLFVETVYFPFKAGARCRSALEDWSLLRQARGRRDATFAPLTCAAAGVDRCRSALGMGHSGEKHSLSARLGKYFRFNSSLKQCISLLRRARGV